MGSIQVNFFRKIIKIEKKYICQHIFISNFKYLKEDIDNKEKNWRLGQLFS